LGEVRVSDAALSQAIL